jgi:uncharacterized membrane protein
MLRMRDLAVYHPQVVHFAIALLFAGVFFRLLSLVRRLSFANPSATILILLGTLAAFAAVRSGEDAHSRVEQVPGVRPAVVAHEVWGERARAAFVGVSALELVALAVVGWGSRRAGLGAAALAALAGLAGLVVLYQAAARGGDLVYGYAGGVGIRSGNADDIGHLLIAATYHQAEIDRKAGHVDRAAELVEMTARRFPDHLEVQIMAAESRLVDRQNPAAALERLQTLPRSDDARLRVRAGLLMARAHERIGDPESARVVLEALNAEFPGHAAVQQQLGALAPRR